MGEKEPKESEVVQALKAEYEKQLREQKENYENQIKEIKEDNTRTIKAILSSGAKPFKETDNEEENEESEEEKAIANLRKKYGIKRR